jgi:hypothetical protein
LNFWSYPVLNFLISCLFEFSESDDHRQKDTIEVTVTEQSRNEEEKHEIEKNRGLDFTELPQPQDVGKIICDDLG